MLIDSLWKQYDEVINTILNRTKGRKLIVYGNDANGIALVHTLMRRHRQVEFIISKSGKCGYNNRIPKERKDILDIINVNQYIILNTSWRAEEIEHEVEEYGYSVSIGNLIHVRHLFTDRHVDNVEYCNYIEAKMGIDISKYMDEEQLGYLHTERICFGAAPTYNLERALDLFHFQSQDKVMDFGCGKGGALLMFQKAGMKSGTGIEYDENLARMAEYNLNKLEVSGFNIIQGDAKEFTELDEYNYFYFYNPFVGETFSRTIQNIEESLNRRERQVFIIYINPGCHRSVIRNGIFKLINCIDSDHYIKEIYVYSNQ